jgi:hypothetical protein
MAAKKKRLRPGKLRAGAREDSEVAGRVRDAAARCPA